MDSTLKEQRNAFTLIELMIVMAIVAIIAAIGIPNLLSSRKAANESGAMASLKAIHNSQVIFYERDPDLNNQKDFGSLAQLQAADLLDDVLGNGVKQGYDFRTQPSTTTPTAVWWADAQPSVPGSTGNRYFALNQSGVILYATTVPISVDTVTGVLTGGTPTQ